MYVVKHFEQRFDTSEFIFITLALCDKKCVQIHVKSITKVICKRDENVFLWLFWPFKV